MRPRYHVTIIHSKMASNIHFGLYLVIIICFYASLVKSSYVPVIFFTSDSQTLPSKAVSAVHKVSAKEFKDDYFDKLKGKGPLVVFLQDTLSLEDFGMYGNIYKSDVKDSSFKNLEESMNKYHSLYIPAVETSKNMLSPTSREWNVWDLNNESISQLDSIGMKENTLIILHLPDSLTLPRDKAIQNNDQMFGQVMEKIEKIQKRFSVIFTASLPSWTSDQEDHIRISRNILEAMDTNDTIPGIFYFNNYTIFHALNITYMMVKEGNTTVDEQTLLRPEFVTDASIENRTIIFNITGQGDGENVTSVTISFKFLRTSAHWSLESLTLDVKSKRFTGEEELQTKDIWAPLGYSYVCENLGITYNKKFRSRTVGIVFDTLQIQPTFNYSGLKFGDPFDCVGFFTIPIWMSIFVTIILILILAVGITFLVDINTMDHFDDPKGKTISVPTVD